MTDQDQFQYLQLSHFISNRFPIAPIAKPSRFEWLYCNLSFRKALISELYRLLWHDRSPAKTKHQIRWETHIGESLSEEQWTDIFIDMAKISLNVLIKEKPYKILYDWGCGQEADNWHNWWTCPIAQQIWTDTFNIISSILQTNVAPDPWESLFGRRLQLSRNRNTLAAQICSATRCVLASMWKGSGPHRSVLDRKIWWIAANEKITYLLKDKVDKYDLIWNPWITKDDPI
ncbi:hypothetical protein XELAEV_18005968mg [Xenopus laevis]|uniref:Uncharacterized protein n=1 Tax=Xenopus laevis TaxID=8355 RepID=A0A974DYE4_XENLA|nr:hypothetical protein XELAEV_18005968mg [Xenopus laevis]